MYVLPEDTEKAFPLSRTLYMDFLMFLFIRVSPFCRIVPSKSEKIMADYFYRKGIEYKYESPLFLKGMGIVYPDFTFLSKKKGEEIYWEHNGKVDDPTYAKKMVRKIHAYENNGIFQGERLILTYETEQTILNSNKIEQLVKRYLT